MHVPCKEPNRHREHAATPGDRKCATPGCQTVIAWALDLCWDCNARARAARAKKGSH